MERSLLKEVNKKNLTARISSKHVVPLYFPNFFGIKQRSDLKWETLLGEKGAPVMADVVSYDASAPEKTRSTIEKMSGDIPKTSIKRGMNESAWNEYKRLRNDVKDDADLAALLDLCFNDTDFTYNGVRARFEFLCMQMMSKGEVKLDKSNNNGLVTEKTLKIVPSANKTAVGKVWSAADATPLQDILDKCEAANDAGDSIQYVVMLKKQFAQLKKANSTAEALKTWLNNTGKVTATKKLINEYLAENDGPQIIVVNPKVKFEDGTHKQTTICPWEDGRICFITQLQVGDVQHGPIAAEDSESHKKKAIMVKKDFVLVTKWSTDEPFKEWTKSEANAFPMFNDPTAIHILRTDATSW